MLSREAKSLFYAAVGPVMWANSVRRRAFNARPERRRAHLGPGQNNYIDGWLNCDANIFTGKADVWLDLRNPLPVADNWLHAAYSHHVVEHLVDMGGHFRDILRSLAPGGVYRVAGPDADMAFDRYRAGDHAWFGDWPDKRRRIGARLDNALMVRGEHVALLTEDLLRELMEDAGFTDIRRTRPRQSHHPELFADVFPFEEAPSEYPVTIVMEGVKPAVAGPAVPAE